MSIALWILQVLLAAQFLWHGWLMVAPPAELIAIMDAQFAPWFRIFVGVTESLGAIERLSNHFSQDGMDGFPQTGQPPQSEIVIHRFPMRELMWQPFPATTGLRNIEHGIEQGSARNRGVSTVGLGFRYEQADDRPFAITQISRITFVQHSRVVYKAH
jgi:hypothetical protein